MQTPHLEKRAEFEEILKDYKPSPEAQQLLKDTKIALLIAATASGRNTIMNEIVKTGHYHYVVSDTTRPRRVNDGVVEESGVEYFFRSEEEMLKDLREGKFVEAEIIHDQQVSGTSVREIQIANQADKIAITDIDLGGVMKIAKFKPDVKIIFIVPPSFKEWLRRISDRGNSTPIELERRMKTAIRIFEAAAHDDRFICVLNDQLDRAVDTVDSVAYRGNYSQDDEKKARQIAQQLLLDTKEYLQAITRF